MAAARPPAPEADPLVIKSLEFIGGMASPTGWRPPPDLPEVAFAGRSNVGKSSLLNQLVHRKKMARVSNTPGRTREINFFKVNDTFMLVDLPGYGYAKASKEQRAGWRPLIEGYLRSSPELRGIVQLLDARHDPTRDDVQMLDFLAELEIPTVVALTKMDKLAAREREARVSELSALVGLDSEQIVPFSAVTGAGRNELAEAILGLLAQPSWRQTLATPEPDDDTHP
jgi:GTP-binding protein